MSDDSSDSKLCRFEVTPFVADGGGGSLAAALQFISILISVGILLGLFVSFVAQWFYLVLVFPIFMGAALGFVGKKTIERYRVRKPLICGRLGFTAGGFCFLAMHYSSYHWFESDLEAVPENVRHVARSIDQLDAKGDQVPAGVKETIAKLRAEPRVLAALQVNSFWGYMNLRATEGVTLIEVGRGGNGFNLGYAGTLIYWLVEMLILAAVPAGLMKEAAARPFCTDCQLWKHESPLILTMIAASVVQKAVEEGDLAKLETLLTTLDSSATASRMEKINAKLDPSTATTISTYACPHCDSASRIEVRIGLLTSNSRYSKQGLKVAVISYPTEALEPLRALASRLNGTVVPR